MAAARLKRLLTDAAGAFFRKLTGDGRVKAVATSLTGVLRDWTT
jgi:hypothetical protein